jgi:hypothetical protein
MSDWQHAAAEMKRIVTSDPEVHGAWQKGGVAAALSVVARQRDEARAVACGLLTAGERTVWNLRCAYPWLTETA